MKKSVLFFGAIAMALMLTGCGGIKPYVDVKSGDYATLQLIPTTGNQAFPDEYYALINDNSKRCDAVYLGGVETDSNTPSRTVKIPTEKPIIIKAVYLMESFNSRNTELTTFELIPEKNKHYVVEYLQKDVDMFNTISDFHIYMKEGDKKVEISSERLRDYNHGRECK